MERGLAVGVVDWRATAGEGREGKGEGEWGGGGGGGGCDAKWWRRGTEGRKGSPFRFVTTANATRRAQRPEKNPPAALESARARRGPRTARGDALEDTRSSMEDFRIAIRDSIVLHTRYYRFDQSNIIS